MPPGGRLPPTSSLESRDELSMFAAETSLQIESRASTWAISLSRSIIQGSHLRELSIFPMSWRSVVESCRPLQVWSPEWSAHPSWADSDQAHYRGGRSLYSFSALPYGTCQTPSRGVLLPD